MREIERVHIINWTRAGAIVVCHPIYKCLMDPRGVDIIGRFHPYTSGGPGTEWSELRGAADMCANSHKLKWTRL